MRTLHDALLARRRSARRPVAMVLVLGVLAGLGVAGAAGPAAAAGPDRFDVVGHGFGHGRGMGQFGARGYADAHGWSHQQILGHFYGGTTVGSISPGRPLNVLLCDQEGVVICSQGNGVGTLRVTSGAPFYVEGNLIPAGTAVQNVREGDRWVISQSPGGCGATGPWTAVGGGSSLDQGIDIDSTVGAPGGDRSKMLEVCGPKRRTYRGVLDHVMLVGKPRVVNLVGLDDYLRGVVPAEMPSTWNAAALRAQAVAARSYAASETARFTGADTCDTIQCQVYAGAGSERATTDAAIAATAGEVRMKGSAVARTEFSSSTGGYTAGGTFPAVVDDGDGVASNSNPHHTWSTQIESSKLESAYPTIGDLQRIEVLERNGLGYHGDGGRVRRVRLVGASANVEVTGDAFRSAAGLKSDWFTATPVAGGGGGGGGTGDLQWFLRSSATPGSPTTQVAYGGRGYTPISCDWDNDGDDTLGAYVNGEWYLRDNLSPGAPTRTFSFGGPGYRPVCGDWNGDGQDSIGVYAGDGMWYLRNDVGPGSPHMSFQYGYTAARPVVGNWDGSDAAVEVGVYDAGSWLLRDNVGAGAPQRNVQYGYVGAVPVIGDWNGDGYDGFGVYDRGSWYLREFVSPGTPTRSFTYGYTGPVPITGRWSPSADGVGVVDG
ncbi:MAG: SpoIID/LytB domain-containing protein [Acidimicrobiales bacterium]|nr:SpoIID/LytB domain-containing protein [Acidimicrobiales bacterium]